MNFRLFFKVEYHKKIKDLIWETGQEENCWKSFLSELLALWPGSRITSPGSLSFRSEERGPEILSGKPILINGVSIHHRILKEGDRIVLGPLRLIYERAELFEPVQEEIPPAVGVPEAKLDKEPEKVSDSASVVFKEKPVRKRRQKRKKVSEIYEEPVIEEKTVELPVTPRKVDEVEIIKTEAETELKPEPPAFPEQDLKPVVAEISIPKLLSFVSGTIRAGLKSVRTGLKNRIRSVSGFRLKPAVKLKKVSRFRLPKIEKPGFNFERIRNLKIKIRF